MQKKLRCVSLWGGIGGALAAWRAAKRWRSHERSETRKGAAALAATPKDCHPQFDIFNSKFGFYVEKTVILRP
jgi:hypothetical protein